MWIYCEEIVWSTGASTITFRRFHRKQRVRVDVTPE